MIIEAREIENMTTKIATNGDLRRMIETGIPRSNGRD
jgi:hypothetical protein